MLKKVHQSGEGLVRRAVEVASQADSQPEGEEESLLRERRRTCFGRGN